VIHRGCKSLTRAIEPKFEFDKGRS